MIDPTIITPSIRAGVIRHNLTRSWRKRMKLTGDNGALSIKVGDDQLFLASARRWDKYTNGIKRRIDDVARQYRLLDVAPFFRGRTVVDVGANIGEFSLFAHRHGARVVSFEADERVFEVLKSNLAETSIRCHCEVLWHSEEEIEFHSSISNADSSIFKPEHLEHTARRLARPLDKVMPSDVDEIFAIKADAEGAEPEVLEGARETLKRTKVIGLDCGAERLGQETVEECEKILKDSGFTTAVARAGRTILVGIR